MWLRDGKEEISPELPSLICYLYIFILYMGCAPTFDVGNDLAPCVLWGAVGWTRLGPSLT